MKGAHRPILFILYLFFRGLSCGLPDPNVCVCVCARALACVLVRVECARACVCFHPMRRVGGRGLGERNGEAGVAGGICAKRG